MRQYGMLLDLKQCKYSAALEDANSTLAIEPGNIKALFRRGLALQHKNQFREVSWFRRGKIKAQYGPYI